MPPTRRLDLTELYVDKTTSRRVMMAAYERTGPGGDIRAAMAEVVREAVEAQHPGPTDAVYKAAVEARIAFDRARNGRIPSEEDRRATSGRWLDAMQAIEDAIRAESQRVVGGPLPAQGTEPSVEAVIVEGGRDTGLTWNGAPIVEVPAESLPYGVMAVGVRLVASCNRCHREPTEQCAEGTCGQAGDSPDGGEWVWRDRSAGER